jgi:hypothetical protein
VKQYKNREIHHITLNRTIKVHWTDKSEHQVQEIKINKKTNHLAEIEHHQSWHKTKMKNKKGLVQIIEVYCKMKINQV